MNAEMLLRRRRRTRHENFAGLPPARPFLLAAARRQPHQAVGGPQPPPFRPIPADKAGGVIGRILYFSRNLKSSAAAELLMAGGGPLLAASSVNRILLGDRAPAPQTVSAFAYVLGIPVGDLAALCDVVMTEDVPAPDYAGELAEYLWEGRRLTQGQIQELAVLAHELRHGFAADVDESTRLEPS